MGLDVDALRRDTPSLLERVHLNHAGASPSPGSVVERVVEHLRLEAEIGGYEAAATVADELDGVHASVARLLGASAGEVALCDSASSAWLRAFLALPLRAGDVVLTCRSEYVTNALALLRAERTLGITVEVLPDDEHGQVDVDALTRRLDVGPVALVSLVHVPTQGGLVNPAERAGAACRAAGVPLLLDACQSVGQLPTRVDELGCDILTATGISFVLAEIRLAQGRLRAAISAYQQALRLATGQGGAAPIGTADLYRGLAELCCEQGDLDAAAAHLATAKKLGEGASLTAWDYRLYVAEARLQAAHGRLDEALSFLDQAERWFVRSPIPNLRPIPALKARIWIRKGALAQAEDWARDQGLDPEGAITFLHAFEYITLARLLAARAENAHDGAAAQAAGRLLDRLLDAAQAGGWGDSRIEILVVQARLQQALGNSAQALAQLRQGLALAGPEGYVQLFVDEGEPLLELLERLSAAAGKQPGSEPGAGHLDRLLRAMRKPARPRAAPSLAQPLVEPLSERELEVLRLLRSELSGPEIAGRLVVSVNTLRTHTKNIYSKLGVNNRRAAVRRAEQLGLI